MTPRLSSALFGIVYLLVQKELLMTVTAPQQPEQPAAELVHLFALFLLGQALASLLPTARKEEHAMLHSKLSTECRALMYEAGNLP